MPKADDAPEMSPVLGVASVTALVFLIVVLWYSFWGSGEPFSFYDLNSYRDALNAVADGTTATYDVLPYPPFAFLPLWFLHVLPPVVGDQIWTALSILLTLAVVLVLAMRMTSITGHEWRLGRRTLVTLTAISATLLMLSVPFQSQVTNGQMSLVVMSLSFLDLSGVLPRRYRGVLVGLAGAIKVTPLVFVVYYLATGQRRNAAVATGSFAAFTAIGWLVFPAGSLQFWTRVGGSEQFGDPARLDNLSIHSMLVRISPGLGAQTWLWVILGAAVIASALWRARRHFQRGEVMESFLTVGAAATVVAPIAWPHYFFWLPIIGIWLWFTGSGRGRVVGGLIYLAYSLGGVNAALGPLLAVSPQFGGIVNILVLIPMAIAVFGLPHRLELRPDSETGPGPRARSTPVAEHLASEGHTPA